MRGCNGKPYPFIPKSKIWTKGQAPTLRNINILLKHSHIVLTYCRLNALQNSNFPKIVKTVVIPAQAGIYLTHLVIWIYFKLPKCHVGFLPTQE